MRFWQYVLTSVLLWLLCWCLELANGPLAGFLDYFLGFIIWGFVGMALTGTLIYFYDVNRHPEHDESRRASDRRACDKAVTWSGAVTGIAWVIWHHWFSY
jgi:energy-converting hydrogenase Eha subunit G